MQNDASYIIGHLFAMIPFWVVAAVTFLASRFAGEQNNNH